MDPMDVVVPILAGLLLLLLLSLTPPGRSLRQWAMARAYARVQAAHEAHVAERKREAFRSLAGTVLELGPGTGVNFRYLPDAVERWVGIEPNPHMHAALRAAAAERDVETEFRRVTAEGMDVADESVDAVISTLVLCSVPDPAVVLRDVLRILKPGGRFVFLEHVAAPAGTSTRRRQRLLKPLWWYVADGCRLDRDLEAEIRAAGFSRVALEAFTLPPEAAPAVVRPSILGIAEKGAAADPRAS